MTSFLSGRRHEFPQALFDDLCRYRHEIFVRNLGWTLPRNGHGDFELDEFDGDDARYVIALREDGTICGTARLLPTTQPYLLEVLFPDLVHALPRRSAAIWELSRFAACTSRAPLAMTGNRLSAALFAEAIHVARALGATTLIGVVSRPLERLLRGLGLHTERLGSDRVLEGEVVVPCSVEIGAHEAWSDARRAPRSHGSPLPRRSSYGREEGGRMALESGSVV